MNFIKIIKYIFLCILLLILSCDEQGLIVNCSDCSSDEPKTVTIELKLDLYNTTPYAVTVKIYKGNIEDNILIGTFLATGTSSKYSVTINEKYTFTATYTDSYGKTYIAVDSAYPRVRYETDQCDEPCYFVYDKVVNLRIKYTK